MLLDNTRDALVLACSTPANDQKNGIFALIITEYTSPKIVLTVLCTQGNPTLPDAAMFQRALREVKYLQATIDAGIEYVDPCATLFVGHITWFRMLLEIIDADCEARGVSEAMLE